MTSAGNANNSRLTVSEFEKRIPDNAELRRVRIEKGLVTFGLGYDKDENFAILWRSNGKAYKRPLTRKGSEQARKSKSYQIRFNGWLYFRDESYDLTDGNSEK